MNKSYFKIEMLWNRKISGKDHFFCYAQNVSNYSHKIDPLSVVLSVFIDYNDLLSTRRQNSENVKHFEPLFMPQLLRLDAHGSGRIPKSIFELCLLSNSDIEEKQFVAFLDACVHKTGSSPDDASVTPEALMTKFQNLSIEFVLPLCEKLRSPKCEVHE